MKIFLSTIIGLIACCCMCLHCTTPTGNEKVSWEIKYVAPLFKEKIILRDYLLPDSMGPLHIVDDTSTTGDTICAVMEKKFINHYYRPVVSLEEKIYELNSATFRIGKLPALKFCIPLGKLTDIPYIDNLPSGTFGATDTISLLLLHHVTFDSTSPPISVTIANQSNTLSFYNLIWSIINSNGEPFLLDTISQIMPQQTIVQSIPFAGKQITRIMSGHLQVTIPPNALLDHNDAITLCIDVRGVAIAEAAIIDSALSLDATISQTFPVSDSGFRLAYMDIQALSIPLTMFNNTCLECDVQATINNIWNSDYCKRESLSSDNILSKSTLDSSFYLGNSIVALQMRSPLSPGIQQYQYDSIHLSTGRFLPSWNAKTEQNEVLVKLHPTLRHAGKLITISKDSKISLGIGPASIDIAGISGEYTIENISHGAPQFFPTSLGSFGPISQAIRGRLKMTNTSIMLNIRYAFLDQSCFEKMNLATSFFDVGSPLTADTFNWQLEHIDRDTTFQIPCELNRFINTFPDTLGYLTDYSFAPFTNLFFDEKSIISNGPSVQISFDATIELKAQFKMIWSIEDTIHFYCASTVGGLGFAKYNSPLVNQKVLSILITVKNETNLPCMIFGVAVPAIRAEYLKNVDSLDLNPELFASNSGMDLIPITGPDGIIIPARNSSYFNKIRFSDKDMQTIISSDSLFIRYAITVQPTGADAMLDTDNISFDSQLILEGIQSTDQLFR